MIRNIKFTSLSALAFLMLTFTACNIDFVENPNGPTLESIENGATLADLQLLAAGIESSMRIDMQFYYWTTSMVGREYYDLNGTDPRYTGELLGEQGAVLDNNGFLTTRSFAARYRTIRNAQVLINATVNSNASLTVPEEDGFFGYAKAITAYQMLLVANRQFSNGIRLDVADPDKLGPFTGSYSESLNGIMNLLDEALSHLSNAGDKFLFPLSNGFIAFDTPAEFAKFVNAIAARVELYRGGSSSAILDRVNKSFMDMSLGMDLGVYHVFGAGGNDVLNPMFNVPNTDLYTVQSGWIADADPLDMRVSAKSTPYDTAEISVPVTLAGLSGDTQVTMFSSNTDPFPIIRNEELILIYAEANIGSDNTEAVKAIDVVRTAAGLEAYSGGTDDATLIDELLNQRRYALFGEGHRWIDMRRFNRPIPVDRTGDVVHEEFPRPATEN